METKNQTMTEEVRVDARVNKEKWDNLTDFIDTHKDTRKHSKQFYLERIMEMADSFREEKQEEITQTAEEYQDLISEMKKKMNDDKE